jgi:predicted glutamine amidotransferase
MCGISGIVNGSKHRLNSMNVCNLSRDMAIANSVRGVDATGVMQLDRKGIYYYKQATGGTDFTKAPESLGYFQDADNAWVTVIHNRAATEGKVTDDNAHPFSHIGPKNNYVLGVHNGTLTNCWKVKGNTCEVDSDWAMQQLAEHGAKALEKFTGAFAFVWYDDSDSRILNIARNNDRPLYFTYVKNTDRMVFASEWKMLTWLADRNNIDLDDDIYEISPYFHYQFNIDNPREYNKVPFSYAAPAVSRVPASWAGIDLDAERKNYVRRFVKLLTGPDKTAVATNESVESDQPAVKFVVIVTPEEVEKAKAAGLHGKEVSAEFEFYDTKSQELWMTFTDDDGDLQPAVIRRVNQATYDTWKVASTLGSKIVGIEEEGIGQDRWFCYILSRAVELEKGTGPDLDSLADAIERSIKVHTEEKKRNASDSYEGRIG